MMKLESFVVVMCCAVLSGVAQDMQFPERELRSKSLKQLFDTSYWKKYWDDNSWHVRCVFVDVDGGGAKEMIACTTSEEDRMGNHWKMWKIDDSGRYRQVLFSGNVFFSCGSECFYNLTQDNKKSVLLGLGMNANIEEDAGNGMRRRVKHTPDCRFEVVSSEKFVLHEVNPSVDVWFRQKAVVSIERLYPEWYFGFDFRPPPPDPHSPYTTWFGYQQPRGDLRPGGGVVKPNCFDALAAEYRKSVKARKGIAGKVDVLAVFLDADNDGNADCYVSSSAEELDGGKYAWTLYMNRSGALIQATGAVYPVKAKKDLCALSPTVNAEKSGFCRVIRFDADPHFVILADVGSLTKVRDAITNVMAHRIEKLACVCFPDEEVENKQ